MVVALFAVTLYMSWSTALPDTDMARLSILGVFVWLAVVSSGLPFYPESLDEAWTDLMAYGDMLYSNPSKSAGNNE